MQTFIPCETFTECARALDYRRLGKQRVECKQILNAIERRKTIEICKKFNEPIPKDLKTGWTNHPATRMWEGYEPALRQYMRAIILEWIDRGYNNNMEIPDSESYELPPWWGREDIHASHRSALLEKDFEYYYGTHRWEDEPKLEYVWPI